MKNIAVLLLLLFSVVLHAQPGATDWELVHSNITEDYEEEVVAHWIGPINAAGYHHRVQKVKCTGSTALPPWSFPFSLLQDNSYNFYQTTNEFVSDGFTLVLYWVYSQDVGQEQWTRQVPGISTPENPGGWQTQYATRDLDKMYNCSFRYKENGEWRPL